MEVRKREEEEQKDRLRRGEMQAVIYKGRVFPVGNGDWLAVRYMMEIRGLSKEEKRGSLKKKIVEEMIRKCRYWTEDEVFGDGVAA